MRVTSLAVGKDPLLGVGGLPLTALGLKVKKDWQPMVSGFSRLPSLILATRMVGQGCGKSRRNWGETSVFQKMAVEGWWVKVR